MSISPQQKNIFQNKLQRGSSNMIGYQTWKYERNLFFDCCRPMSGFYWHLLLKCKNKHLQEISLLKLHESSVTMSVFVGFSEYKKRKKI